MRAILFVNVRVNDCCSCLRRSEFDTTGNYPCMCERSHEVYMLKMDQALLTFHNELPHNISVYYTSDYCYKCLYQPLATVGIGHNISVVVSTQFTLTLRIVPVDGNGTLCSLSQTFEEAGHYSLWMRQPGLLNDVTCSLTVDRSPNNAYLPLLAAFLILAFVAVFWASSPYILRCSCTQRLKNRICLFCCHRSQNSMEMEEANNEHCVDKSKTKSSRLKSLDTFRGFSLTVMVFVNYGGGGYWFFQHAPWNA